MTKHGFFSNASILSILLSILYHLLLTYMIRIDITFFLSVYHFVYPQINKDFRNICNHIYDKIKHLTLLHILIIRFPDLPERRGKPALPVLCGLLGIFSRWNLFLIHKIPIRLHTVLIICRRPFLAQQFHIADLLLEHIHKICPVTQSHHSGFRR